MYSLLGGARITFFPFNIQNSNTTIEKNFMQLLKNAIKKKKRNLKGNFIFACYIFYNLKSYNTY